jgi:hypothetical protein
VCLCVQMNSYVDLSGRILSTKVNKYVSYVIDDSINDSIIDSINDSINVNFINESINVILH